jgi:hypothetical protein
MSQTRSFIVAEEDLSSLKAAQKLIQDNLDGQELPLEVLLSIAVRAVNAHVFANEVLATLTGKDLIQPQEEAG